MVAHQIYWWLRWTWGGYPISSPNAGYNIFSGPLADITLLGGVIVLYHHHQCHTDRCRRLAWHHHPEHGHPVCKRHYPRKEPSHGVKP